MSKLSSRELKELAQRVADEPDNLGLRVTYAGHLREAGRVPEAIELYRSVAIEYRDQGRSLQAIAVCKSLLAITPDDMAIRALLHELEAPPKPPPPVPPRVTPPKPISAEPVAPPPRRPEILLTRPSSSFDETPLPTAMPYHLADPTTSVTDVAQTTHARGSSDDIEISTAQLAALQHITPDPDAPEPGADESLTHPITRLPQAPDDDDDDAPPRLPPARASTPDLESTDTEDDVATLPTDRAGTGGPIDPFGTSFFLHLPADRRAAALSRFQRKVVRAGEVLIARGAMNHAFIIVLRGELAVGRNHRAIAVGPGEYAGEDSLLARGPATGTVVVTREAVVLLLPASSFYDIVGAFPALWAELKDLAASRA